MESVERDFVCACVSVRTEKEEQNDKREAVTRAQGSRAAPLSLNLVKKQLMRKKKKEIKMKRNKIKKTLISFVNRGRRPVATEKKKKKKMKKRQEPQPSEPITIFITIAHSINRSHIFPAWGPQRFPLQFVFFSSSPTNRRKKKEQPKRTVGATPWWKYFVCIIKLASDRWASFSHTAKTTSSSCSFLLTFF